MEGGSAEVTNNPAGEKARAREQSKGAEQGGRISSFTGKLCAVLMVVGVGSANGGCGIKDLL